MSSRTGNTSRTNNTIRTNNASRTSNPSQRYNPHQEYQKLKNRLDSLSKSANIHKDLIAILDFARKIQVSFIPPLRKLAEQVSYHNKEIKNNIDNRRKLRDVTKKHIDILYDRVRKLEGKPSMETSQAASTLAGLGSSSSTSGSSTTTSSGTKRRRTGGKKRRKSRRKTRRKSPKTKRKKKRSKSKTKRRR